MKKFYILTIFMLGSSGLTGCMTHPALSQEQRPPHWGALIQAQHNFYQISQDVYRSEQPSRELLDELKQHQIQVVINLRSRNDDLKLLDQQEFKLVHLPIHTWAIDRHDLLQVMRQIQLARYNRQNILLHCYHGSDRTGASVAMYRIIYENWSIQEALQEMKQGGYGYHPIWRNIENLFTPQNIKWIRQQLTNPS